MSFNKKNHFNEHNKHHNHNFGNKHCCEENEKQPNESVESQSCDCGCEKPNCSCHSNECECKNGGQCTCGDNCECGEDCTCKKDCECKEDCKCGEESCSCQDEKTCDDKCSCEKECDCDECECEDIDDCTSHHPTDNYQEALNYLELAQRVQAEFDNYRKRTIQAEKDAKQKGIMEAVEKLLPVIDSVDSAKRQVNDDSFTKALDLINNQMLQSLSSLGVEKIEAVGKEFDPNYHNAIMTGNDSQKKEDEILQEFQAGFKLGEKVIRHSVVMVNKL